ncbi:DUF1127 domain-containing protein [Phyllobacterium sp. 22552]|uniref:DUF1127 domain-containing protein n=1 Tax=Phyllobacterium sp. 22552 TaxID=3453941 RepID=UPI003F840110
MSTIDTIDACCKTNKFVEPRHSLFHRVSAALNWFSLAMMKRRTRIHLSELTDDQLRDIGISKREARREVERSFWD